MVFAALAGAFLVAAQDPTVPSERMAESLKARAAATSALRLQALVVGSSNEGVALIGTSALGVTPVRKGTQFAESVDGVSVTMKVRSVGVDGVQIETSQGSAPLFLPGSFQSIAAPTNQSAEFVRYVEATEVPLEQLLRLLADQTGAPPRTASFRSSFATSRWPRPLRSSAARRGSGSSARRART